VNQTLTQTSCYGSRADANACFTALCSVLSSFSDESTTTTTTNATTAAAAEDNIIVNAIRV